MGAASVSHLLELKADSKGRWVTHFLCNERTGIVFEFVYEEYYDVHARDYFILGPFQLHIS